MSISMTLPSLWRRRSLAQCAATERTTTDQSVAHIWLATLEAPLCEATAEQFQKSMPAKHDAIPKIWVSRYHGKQARTRCSLCHAISTRFTIIEVYATLLAHGSP